MCSIHANNGDGLFLFCNRLGLLDRLDVYHLDIIKGEYVMPKNQLHCDY